ncbi:MAG: protein phosphatase 2C domain-containing protein [Gammaproteobacteria bacterium]|nr:protein phosphatase 2C domain-containing protein [Gammaproteobacteria bacterium]
MNLFATQTHPGPNHKVNEDATGNLAQSGFWVVADGMGGHAAGDVASALVCETILAERKSGVSMRDTVTSAHAAVVGVATRDVAKAGMGATVVAVQITRDQAEVVWVGDSRCYLWRGGSLEAVTKDHSLVQHLLNTGKITEAEAANHPERHVITQTLGVGEPQADIVQIGLQRDDWLLLCTDGLNDVLTHAEISAVLAEAPDLEYAANRLVELVKDAKGRDDVTVTLVHYNPQTSKPWIPVLVGVGLGLLGFAIAIWTDAI